MATDQYDSLDAIRREAGEAPARRIVPAAEDAITFLLAAEAAYKRLTGRDLSPETAAAFLRQSRQLG
jgi:hypothetical protein